MPRAIPDCSHLPLLLLVSGPDTFLSRMSHQCREQDDSSRMPSCMHVELRTPFAAHSCQDVQLRGISFLDNTKQAWQIVIRGFVSSKSHLYYFLFGPPGLGIANSILVCLFDVSD